MEKIGRSLIYTSSALTMWRYFNLLISIIVLIISALPPETRWSLHFEFHGQTVEANLFHWLFMFSLIFYIPLLISGALLLVVDLSRFLRSRMGRNTFNLAFFSLIALAALYRLNDWVFSRIF